MGRRSLQRLIQGALVLGLSILLATPALAERVMITYWPMPGDPEDVILQEAIAGFEAENPNIKVDVQPVSYAEMPDKVMLSVLGDAAPDLINYERSAVLNAVAAKQLFLPLDGLLPEDLLAPGAFIPFAMEEVRWQGKTYALPWRTDVRAAIWNQDFFGAAGLDEERFAASYDELEQYAQKLSKYDAQNKLTRLGFAPWRTGLAVLGWMLGFGGGVFDPVARKPTISRESNIAAMEWELGFARRFPDAVVRSFDFAKGELAISNADPRSFSRVLQQSPDLRIGVGSFPRRPGGENPSWSGGGAHAIPRGARHPQEAAAFLAYLIKKEQIRLFELVGAMPTYMPAIRTALATVEGKHPQMFQFYKILLESHGRPPLWFEMIQALTQAESAVIRLQKTPRQALNDAQRAMEITYREVLGW